MAIAPSKLGHLVAEEWHSDEGLVRRLREARLVRDDVTDDDLRATFRRARDEHLAKFPEQWEYNSPNERVRVFLAQFLTDKGKAWAVPLDSLTLPDDTPTALDPFRRQSLSWRSKPPSDEEL
jgi:hypothetical protein